MLCLSSDLFITFLGLNKLFTWHQSVTEFRSAFEEVQIHHSGRPENVAPHLL